MNRVRGAREFDGAGPPPMATPDGRRSESTAELVRQASEQLSRLVRDEIRLGVAELKAKGKHAGIGAGLFGGAAMFAVYGTAAVVAAAILLLALVIPAWLSALLVGLLLLVIAAVLAIVGRSEMRRATPPFPREAVESAKSDAAMLKERVRR